jgi:alkylated DNA repair dioxygenase AlkB
LEYDPSFLSRADHKEICEWIAGLHPIWEERYSKNHPPPAGKKARALLRPVYWLGSWQFACLGYYHPPRGTLFRCVEAEPFPPVLERLVKKMEGRVRQLFPAAFVPRGWTLNTCLVNLYGTREIDGKIVDTARVGEHKDYEPGPVASLSLGDRALFQFVSSRGHGQQSQVALQQWLEDGSLQIFGGDKWKRHLFHRVQRVEKKYTGTFPSQVTRFKTRRVNFTFRFVPPQDIVPYSNLPAKAAEDVEEYMKELAKNSRFFARALKARGRK